MKALPSINLKNSSIFSLKLSAFELNTKSLLVKYANNTAKIIAIALDIFSSNLKHDVIIAKEPILTTVVKTPKNIYKTTSTVKNFFNKLLNFSGNIFPDIFKLKSINFCVTFLINTNILTI